MATVTTTILTDSLDERIQNGVETVVFFDPTNGQKREIELGEANRKHFANHLEKLAKYVAASRTVEVVNPAKSAPKASGELAKVREWAKANGYDVGDRGRIKADIVEAYHSAQKAIANPDTDAQAAGDELVTQQITAEQAQVDELLDEVTGNTAAMREVTDETNLSDEDILELMAEIEAEGSEVTLNELKSKVDEKTDSE